MQTVILPTEHVTAMCKAMRETPTLTVERTRDTVVATHVSAGPVYRALRTRADLWIVRHVEGLFAQTR